MIKVQKLKVRSLVLDYNEISWEIADTTEDVLDYSFQLLRSESPAGPFDPLTEPFEDRYFFIDSTILPAHRWRMYFYLLRVTQKLSNESVDFGPVQKEPEADLIALEIRRHQQLLFREFAGRRSWVLPIRTFGQRCPRCWNATLQKQRVSSCGDCFSTGFLKGFLAPIEVWLQIDPSSNSEQNTNVGPQHQQNTTARLGYYPPLKPNDLIIEPENIRWRVVSVAPIEHLRAPVRQEAQLHAIPPKDIEYSVPLDLGVALKDLFLSPPRSYTNPQNLEATKKEDPDIFELYRIDTPDR